MIYLSDWGVTRDAWLSLKNMGLSILLSNGVVIIGLISSLVLTFILLPRILERERIS